MCMKRRAVSILLSCMIVMTATAQSKTEKPETIFYINNKPVTSEEFVYLYRKNHQHKPEEFTREKIEEYLTLFINYKLKVEEALSRGMDTTHSFRKEYNTYRNELLRPYTPDAKVLDSMVWLTYERLKEEINASHILVRVDAEASPKDTLAAFSKIAALRQRALAGEDFGMLASEFSEEPGAEQTRGNLGFFTAMQMVFPFEQAAYLTPVGKISEPVRTRFGYHIVKVIDRQPARGEVEVSHIMIRTETPDDVAARNSIFEVYDKLQKGMAWDELCAEYSQDLNTREKGGRLRPFGVGAMASVPAFQDAAFALRNPGDISDPVHSQFGWHILQLESRIPLPPFEELKSSLTQRVSRDDRVRISSEVLRERMRKEFGYRDYPTIEAALFDHADAILRQDYASVQNLSDSTLFYMGNSRYSVKTFLAFIATAGQPGDGTAAPRQQLEDLLSRYTEKVQMDLLEESVRRESPDYRWLVREYYEGILLFEIMEDEIWNRAVDDTTGQRSYFAAHAEKYIAGGKAQTFEEARASVISDYQTSLEDAWIRELKRKFAVKVEKRAKKRAFARLIDSKDDR